MTELWSLVQPQPITGMTRVAQRLEETGWDGVYFTDSQVNGGDCFSAMTLAVAATTRLQVGTGVVNPVTRHPFVQAGAIATIAALGRRRAWLGIGRGDAALANIGQAPAGMAHLEDYVRAVRELVQGGEVPFSQLARFAYPGARPLAEIGLAGAPSGAKLKWLPEGGVLARVEVAATGPRTIAFAAAHSDSVMVTVGADDARLKWAVDLARANGAQHITALVNVVAHPEIAKARALGRMMSSAFARFSVMDGTVRGPMAASAASELETLHGHYDMRDHGAASESGQSHGAVLSDAFLDSFGVLGDAAYCRERLQRIVALGIDRLVLVGPTPAGDQEAITVARRTFADEVFPFIRG